MFKKILPVGLALVFSFGILATSVFRTSAQTLAESSGLVIEEIENAGNQEASPEAKSKEKIDYALVWPGMLPDHFLYPVKMFRDKVWLFLATDDLKKAELLLKLADKRIWSAQMLVEKNKQDLGVATATKAEKYLRQAIDQAKIAQEKGQDLTAFWQKLSLAIQKHEEVLTVIREKTTDSAKQVINEMLETNKNWLGEVEGKI